MTGKLVDRAILSYTIRSVLSDLVRGEQPTFTIPRRVLLTMRNNKWVSGRVADGLAITPRGREALEADRDAVERREHRLRNDASRIDQDQGP